MDIILSTIAASSKELLIWFIGFFILFSLLARFVACNPGQPFWRKDSLTDIIYFFLMPIFTRFVRIIFIGVGVFFLFHGQEHETIQQYLQNGYGPLAKQPIWLQAAIIFIASDFILYWTHRLFHGARLWRFHAVHHSPEQVDWLSTYRFHPINTWFSFTLVDVCMLFLGFSPAAVSEMAGVNMIYSAMVHANLNWTFGPFRYLFASPVFHRWHHTSIAEGRDKNFAPTFPILDIIFGTFYMPEKQLPQHYGVPGSNIPTSFFGQLIWPFKHY